MKKFYLALFLFVLSFSCFSDEWRVCFGSFSKKENADALSKNLLSKNVKTSIVDYKIDGKKIFRVLYDVVYSDSKSANQKRKEFSKSNIKNLSKTEFWVFKDFVENVVIKESVETQNALESQKSVQNKAQKVVQINIDIDKEGSVNVLDYEKFYVERNVEPEKRTLVVKDSDNGNPIPEADVDIDKIWNVKTDTFGKAFLPDDVDDGEHSIVVSKDGVYVPTEATFSISEGEIVSAPQISLPQTVDYDRIKIILDWGEYPYDLDSHAICGNQHVYYSNKVTEDMDLDHDDTTSYGPETVTLKNMEPSKVYKYYVYNYSDGGNYNSDRLSNSSAQVRVYFNNDYKATFKVQENQVGLYWHVFDIVNNEIVVVDTVSNNGM